MSSRALRRLQQDATVIRVPASGGQVAGGGEEEDEPAEGPGFDSSKSRKPAVNPFAMLVDDGEGEGGKSEEEEEEQGENTSPAARMVSGGSSNKKKKKRKKKSKPTNRDQTDQPQGDGGGVEDVDAAIREVNELLGETPVRDEAAMATSNSSLTAAQKSLLSVDKRFLNADNEMRRIFGARVVRAEAGRRRAHRRTRHRSTFLATPKDTWPSMDKPGLSMQLAENKDGCQYFVFEHSQEYQRIQFRFWDAVETFDPEAIVEVLHAHPYHIDSLLQLSEVCKMSEDIQMATELIERALYCFECNLHALFNFSQGNCRLSYSRAENRPFFIALFRHLSYVGRKGCHRTALEFCKLLLGLEPEGDPLCCLLMIDYFALRAGEYSFLLNLFNAWESHRNLSQLPNFAFSIPLALFHSSSSSSSKDIPTSEDPVPTEADSRLQDALLMFPSVLLPLMEKCSVNLDPRVVKHSFFADAELSKDPSSLQLLVKLYIERSHSLWKEPEVLTWLEENSRQVVARVDAKDNLVADYAQKRQKRYIGTPRNIYRHIIMSDFDQVAATLPRDISDSPILMYDPLPPLDSTSGYSRPQRQRRVNILREDENPFLLFLRSLLPTFNHEGDAGRLVDAGDHPNPAVRQLQAQLAAARAQRNQGARPRQPQAAGEGNDEQEVGGAVGGVAPPNPEGQPGQPLDIQRPLEQLVDLLVQFLGGRGVNQGAEDSPLSSDQENSSDEELD